MVPFANDSFFPDYVYFYTVVSHLQIYFRAALPKVFEVVICVA